MSQRFYSESPLTGGRATLGGPEAHHLLHVMRLNVGQQITVFDGLGAEYLAVIEKLGRGEVELEIVDRVDVSRELPFALTLAVALPKGDRQRWLIEKIVELGVTCLVPLRTTRGVAQPNDNALQRLRRAVIEASKQCGRNRLAEIAMPVDFDNFVTKSPENALRIVTHPDESATSIVDVMETNARGDVMIAVGPEGGFTEQEIASAIDSGLLAANLGPRILRVETAAVALAAIVALRHR